MLAISKRGLDQFILLWIRDDIHGILQYIFAHALMFYCYTYTCTAKQIVVRIYSVKFSSLSRLFEPRIDACGEDSFFSPPPWMFHASHHTSGEFSSSVKTLQSKQIIRIDLYIYIYMT